MIRDSSFARSCLEVVGPGASTTEPRTSTPNLIPEPSRTYHLVCLIPECHPLSHEEFDSRASLTHRCPRDSANRKRYQSFALHPAHLSHCDRATVAPGLLVLAPYPTKRVPTRTVSVPVDCGPRASRTKSVPKAYHLRPNAYQLVPSRSRWIADRGPRVPRAYRLRPNAYQLVPFRPRKGPWTATRESDWNPKSNEKSLRGAQRFQGQRMALATVFS